MFDDLETDYFDSDIGVKQGCVLSPILFSLYMNELAKSLELHDLGIRLSRNILISGLFFADDVVLLAENEQMLKHMLYLTADFGTRLKLKFNESKSKILVVGKKLDPTRKWEMGELRLEECDSYKYLGIHIARNLNDNKHISETLKKANRIAAACKSTILGHNGFNRFTYGDTLWNSIITPSLNYGCSIWVPSSIKDKNHLESTQFQFGKFLFRAPNGTSKATVLGELGWKSISSLQDRLRLKFYDRLIKMEEHRWPKMILLQLFGMIRTGKSITWPWVKHMKNLLTSIGLDHIWCNDSPVNRHWINSAIRIHNSQQYDIFLSNMTPCKAMVFRNKHELKLEDYLKDPISPEESILKFKARAEVLEMEGRKLSWKSYNGNGNCTNCNLQEQETVTHFLLICPSYSKERISLFTNPEDELTRAGGVFLWETFMSCNAERKKDLLLGYKGPWESIIDRHVKKFLYKAWSTRNCNKNGSQSTQH